MSTSIAILGRAAPQQKKRPICVLNARESLLITPGVQTHRVAPQGHLSAILEALRGIFDGGSHVTLYVCAGTHTSTAPGTGWYTEPASHGWTVEFRGDSNPARRTAKYVRAESPTFDIRHTSAWFGDMQPSALDTLEALYTLERYMELNWHHDKSRPLILASAAQTGLDLLEKMLPFDVVFPVLDEEMRSLLRRTSTQARIEMFPDRGPITEFYEYDQQFAYGAQLIKVPCPIDAGTSYQHVSYTPVRTGLGETEMWRPAKYRAVWKIPSDWNHVGLLPELLDEWTWPNEPGTWHQGWIDNRELLLAKRHKWDVHLHEGILFGLPDGKRKWDPLREWRTFLLDLWTSFHLWEQDGDTLSGLCKAGVRAMVLGAIGTWHRSTGRATVVVPQGQPLPPLDDMLEPPRMTAHGLEYVARVPIHKSQQKWQRPEWSSAIWAAQRVSLTDNLLEQDPRTLIACNTDGMQLTVPRSAHVYEMLSASRPGYWRLKGQVGFAETVPWPVDRTALNVLSAIARGAASW